LVIGRDNTRTSRKRNEQKGILRSNGIQQNVYHYLEAVKNSVISELNNGFVEGNNNKIKAIKRTMYGRAIIDLLRVKVLFAR